jgi:hypothetical protein
VAGAGVIIAGEYTPVKFDRGMSDEWYLYTIAAFGIAVIYSYIAYTSAKDDERRQYASVSSHLIIKNQKYYQTFNVSY